MATITTTTTFSTLDIVPKYKELIAASLGTGSVYIRAKETLNELAVQGDLTDVEKAKLLANVLTGINSTLVSSSMSTALQWAEQERVTELKKLEAEKNLDALDKQVLLTEAQTSKTHKESIETQARIKRMYGTPSITGLDTLVALDNTGTVDSGKVFYEIEGIDAATTLTSKKALLTDAQVREANAAIHKIVADTYQNYGSFTYALANNGVSSVVPTHGTHKPHSDYQRAIAGEQAKGYAWNAWANAATSTASTLGTALASGFVDTAKVGALNDALTSIVGHLGSVSPPSI